MNDDERLKNLTDRLDSYLRMRGKRVTPERHAVLYAVYRAGRPVSASDVNDRLEEQGYHVSVGTVYNALGMMAEAGLLRKAAVEWGRSATTVYETVEQGSTVSLVCEQCGQVREVRDAEVAAMLRSRRYPRFTPRHHALYLYGLCSKCLRRQRNAERDLKQREKRK